MAFSFQSIRDALSGASSGTRDAVGSANRGVREAVSGRPEASPQGKQKLESFDPVAAMEERVEKRMEAITKIVAEGAAQSIAAVQTLKADLVDSRIQQVVREGLDGRRIGAVGASGGDGGTYQIRWRNDTADANPENIHRLEESTDGGDTWTAVDGADGVLI